MYRVLLCMAAALLAFDFASAPALADDNETCHKGTGEDSIAACSRLIQRNPRNAVAYNNRGIEYNHKGDYDRAIPDYDQAIRIDPKYANAYVGRGNAYHGKGDYVHAITDYGQAIRLDPK